LGRDRHDGRRVRGSLRRAAPFGGGRRAACRPAGRRSDRERPDRFLPQPVDGGARLADPALRHPRLRNLGPHRLRVGRPGDRHRAQADPARQRRLRACRRIRFDDQSGRAGGILPAVGGIGRQRRAATREPPIRRGAHIYAELAGDGNSLSSYRITDSPPDGDGPIQSMRAALADAGAAPDDVDYINAHGTSTYMNDKSESAAIHTVFGDKTADVAVSSTKSSMGHLIAAAGAVEVVVCALAIRHGRLPVNANLRERDPDCDLNLVVAPTQRRVRMTLSNSFGFGGSNSYV